MWSQQLRGWESLKRWSRGSAHEMDVLLRGYDVNQATWFYLSTLLIVAVFFRFNRILSLRNLDLLLLLLVAPGLLFVSHQVEKETDDEQTSAATASAEQTNAPDDAINPADAVAAVQVVEASEQPAQPGSEDSREPVIEPMDPTRKLGYVWLFSVSGLYLIRLLADPILQRRPQLGQNLNSGGLIFLCAAAFVFLSTKAITESLPESTQETVRQAGALTSRESIDNPELDKNDGPAPGPAASLLAAPATIVPSDLAARILSILAHGMVVAGLIFAGKKLFGDVQLGLAAATLYMLLPGTAFDVAKFNHVLPAALIIWAVVYYRNPITAGVLLGLASGAMFFPVFLLPLWFSFYGRRSGLKFGVALGAVALVLVTSLAFTSHDPTSFVQKILGSIDLKVLAFRSDGDNVGFWNEAEYFSAYRIPVIALFCIQLIVFTWLPRQKTVEHLLSHSAAIVLSTQFWYTQQGGVYVLWYLPMLLMVIFRPRLLHLLPPDGQLEANTAAVRDRRAGDAVSPSGSVRSQLYR